MPNPKSCTHIKVTGVRCESPALRGEQFCYFHQHAHRGVRRPPRSRLHPMALIESQESIQASLMEVINGLLRNTLDAKRAELILRALHIAVKNARNIKFDSEVYPKVREIPEYAEPASQPLTSLAGRAKAPESACSVDDAENKASMPEPELDMPYTAAIPLQLSREERAEREHQAKLDLERARQATIRAQLERAGRTVANGNFSPISHPASSQKLPHPSERSQGGNPAVDPAKPKPPVSVKSQTATAEKKSAAAPKERKNAAQRASAG